MRTTLLFLIFFGSIGNITAQKDSSMKFDLGLSKGQNTHLWPIIRIRKSPNYKNTEILFSVFQNKTDGNKSVKHSHLFPLYYYDSTLQHRDLKIATLFYPSLLSFNNDFCDSTKSFRFAELAPGISLIEAAKSTDGLFVKNNALFFLWFKKDVKMDKSYAVLFPLYWNFKNGNDKKQAIFPVYWSYKNENVSNKILFPLVWNMKNKNYRSFSIIPLLSYGKSKSGNRSHLITPLFYQFKDTNSLKQCILPVYWHQKKDEVRKYRSMGKLHYYNYHKENRHFFPLYFSHMETTFWDTVSTKVIFPIVWNIQRDSRKIKALFPLYWDYKSKDIHNNVLFPAVWILRNNTYKSFTFAPLFSCGKSVSGNRTHLMLTPFYWQTMQDNTSTLTVFPVYRHKKTDELRNFNLSGDTVFYHYTKESTRLFPVYFYNRESNYRDTSFSRVLFPLIWDFKFRDKHNRVFFPLVWKFQKSNYSSFTFIPLISKGNSPSGEKSHFIAAPFYWQFKDGNTLKQFVFPFYYYKKYEEYKLLYSGDTVLYPFKHEVTRIFPLYSSVQTQNNMDSSLRRIIFPLYWKFEQNKIHYQQPYLNKTTVFPVYFYRKGVKNTSRVLFPLYFNFHSTDNSSKTIGITPLFWVSKSKKNNKFQAVVFPVYWYKKIELENSKRIHNTIIPIWYSRVSISGADTHKLKMLFPIYLKSAGWKGYNSTTILPFYSKGSSKNGKSKHFAVTPLYWQYQSEYVKRNIVFPVYWYKIKNYNSPNPKICHTVFPVFYRRKDSDKTRLVIFPVFWFNKSDYSRRMTVFPLYFENKTRNSHRVMLFPLFWYKTDSERGALSSSSAYVFPWFWYRNNGLYRQLALIPFYYSLISKTDTDHIIMRSPLFWDIVNPYLSLKMALPFYYSLHKFNTQRQILFPVYWFKKTYSADSSFKTSHTLFPLVWYTKNSDSLLNPVSKSFAILPLFYWSKDYTNTDYFRIFTPLYWAVESPYLSLRIVMPFYYSIRNFQYNKKIIFPVYWYKKTFYQDQSSQITHTLLPLIRIKKQLDSSGRITSSALGVFPFYYSSKSKLADIHSTIIFPLYWDFKKKNYSLVIAFPFYLSYKKEISGGQPYRNILFFTPLYWQWDNNRSKRTLYFPLYLKTEFKNGDVGKNVMGILYRQQQSKSYKSVQILWPLINYTRDSNLRYFHIAPLIWYKKSPGHNYFSVMPLFYSGKKNETKKVNILWQLLNYKETPTGKKYGILFHAFHFEKYKNGDHAFRFIYLLYANVYKNGSTEKSFFPVYYLNKDSSGNKYFNAAFAFYVRSSKKIEPTIYFYTEERVFWIVRLRSNYKYLKAKGIVKSRRELR